MTPGPQDDDPPESLEPGKPASLTHASAATTPETSPSESLLVRNPDGPTHEPVTAAVGLAMAVDELDRYRELHTQLFAEARGAGQAGLFRYPDRRVLVVVGDSPLAAALRELIDAGAVPPWTHAPMPTSVTDLAVIREQAGTGAHTALVRAGFTRVEEIAALPDACLAELRNMGPIRLAAIRGLAPHRDTRVAHPGPGDAFAERHATITGRVGPVRARLYQDLVDMLARSDLPGHAVDLVATSLAADDLPPADPAVLAVLAAAREPAMLTAYRDTHRRT